MFFLQMSGFPGSGKSTLSRYISKKTNVIVIDHDIVKSALLESLEENRIDFQIAGKISYNIEWSLIDFYLSQGQSVILDSRCFYSEMVEKGMELCNKHKAKYKYIECYLNNFKEIENRLKNRIRMISQIHKVESEKVFLDAINNSKKPSVKYLTVDSGRPIDTYIQEVIDYLQL